MAPAEVKATQAEGEPAGPRRVLLVDDNDELRAGFNRMLRRAGHIVIEARNGRDATALAATEQFDLVVSDVHMPDMNGIELLRIIHEGDPDLPVLLVSGEPDLASAMKAVEYGALEYIVKPVSLERFRASVAHGLEVRRARLQAKLAVRAQSGERVRERPLLESDELTGRLLGGRYRIGALLGSGGMGAVYEAVREDLARMPVAIKVLHASLATDADAIRRFQREAHAVAAIAHPNIVRIIDFQATPAEPAFLVMERLHGVTLGDAVRAGRRFSVEETARIAVQVLAALEAAHAAKIVHRDLKPDNVFLTSVVGMSDVVKVLDFGVAKLSGVGWDEKLTQTGMVMGTPAYMAPEQARGAAADARSDLYAVGCLMFEALTGRAPFVADNYNALIYEIQQSSPPPLKTLRTDVEEVFVAIIGKAMARTLEARFQSARTMADALTLWAAPHSNRTPNSSPMSFAATMPPPAKAGSRGRRPKLAR